jgi:hypothetical protein
VTLRLATIPRSSWSPIAHHSVHVPALSASDLVARLSLSTASNEYVVVPLRSHRS